MTSKCIQQKCYGKAGKCLGETFRWCCVFLLLLSAAGLKSQGFKARHYLPKAVNNTARAVFEVSPGNYLAAGFMVDSLQPNVNNLTILGLDSLGKITWSKYYPGNQFQYLNNNFISRCFYKQGNNVYYTGCVNKNGRAIGVLTKFNLNGDTIWQKLYHSPDSMEDVIPQMVTGSVDGGFLITGFFQHWGQHYSHCLIIKTDKNGNELWRKQVGKTAPDVMDGNSIIQDSATKKIVIAGYQYKSGAHHHDNIVILDSLGNKLIQRSYAGYGGYAKDLIQTKDKKIVFVGWQSFPPTPDISFLSHSYAVKFDLNNPGVPIWRLDFVDKKAYYNTFTSISEVANGDLLVSGVIDTMQSVYGEPFHGPSNMLSRLTVITAQGIIKQQKYYDYKRNPPDEFNSSGISTINVAPSGCWLGNIIESNSGLNPFFIVKYDAHGCDSTAAHCATLNLVGVNESSHDPVTFSVYPNPANQFLTLNLGTSSLPHPLEITLVNALGQAVITEVVSPGKKQQLIPLNNLPAGLYQLLVTNNGSLIFCTKVVKNE
jgi:hypothetical protein